MPTLLRVLIVEDSEDDAMLLVRQLMRGGYEPTYEVVSTPNAMAQALTKEWDVVISDYSMPQFSGLAALDLHKQKKTDVPFIIVSGVIGEETAVAAMKAGAHDYIMKGNLARLVPAIEREIREAAIRRDRRRAEEDLRETQRVLLTLLSNLPGMAYRCRNDPDWTMEFVSEGCLELTGYLPEDLINNKNISYAKIIVPEDRNIVWNSINEALKSNNAFQVLYRIKTIRGEIKWVWEKGRGVYSPSGSFVALEGFISDITERKEAEEKLRTSLQEKDVLLKEIHHRVKNNLQVIYSLLSLQSGYVRDPQFLAMFQESRNRIKSMAMIHEVLYQSKDLASVNISKYINALVDNLFRSYGVNPSNVGINLDVGDVRLSFDTAIPCGLIINELVSNSLKYAFPDGRTGHIYVGLHSTDEGTYVLAIRDDGVGMPESMDFRTTSTLGLQLVTTLTEQLGGSIDLDRTNGTKFTIKFNETKSVKRRPEK